MIANLMMTARDVIKEMAHSTGKFCANEEVIVARNNICAACSRFKNDSARCEICGCYIKAKIMLFAAKCPIGNW